jgi:hypothetical protein
MVSPHPILSELRRNFVCALAVLITIVLGALLIHAAGWC